MISHVLLIRLDNVPYVPEFDVSSTTAEGSRALSLTL